MSEAFWTRGRIVAAWLVLFVGYVVFAVVMRHRQHGIGPAPVHAATMVAPLPAQAPWPPTFAQYATADTLKGPAAPIDFASDPDARRFRTLLNSAREDSADLNGHFTFVIWGCGTGCSGHVILDLATGKIYDDTLVNFSCEEIDYRRLSGLVIDAPDPSLTDNPVCRKGATRYFTWGGKGLVELRDPRNSG